jgi:PAS domain S-box-containing protein
VSEIQAPSYPEMSALLNEVPLEPIRFLRRALMMSTELARWHASGSVHGALTPAAFAFSQDGDQVVLIPQDSHNSITQRNLPYLAPDSIGRRRNAPDERSDLYSLGVIFYQMLTGSLPFTAQDELAWFHSHLARPAVFSAEHARQLPSTLRGIILKLLAKDPNERYQTAQGLLHDLRICHDTWLIQDFDSSLPLGRQDLSQHLQISATLYGRQEERARLHEALDRVARQGETELFLITGPAGVGKTALIQELQDPVQRRRGFFINGKFDQLNRGMPYVTHAQAFQGLIRQILGESEARIAWWRLRLRQALGQQGQLIINIIPSLELIIGPQPTVPDLPPDETQNRFHTVFQKFVSVFASAAHPLVMFLDDLQWADAGSLKLLEHLVTHPDLRHVLFIGALRPVNEPGDRPLTCWLQTIRRGRMQEVALGPLVPIHIQSFLADTLQTDRERVAPLAKLLHQKTGGNPFFLTQYVKALASEKLIVRDSDSSTWAWDTEAIRGMGYTDNVIDFILARLRLLPPVTQKLMQYAACLGNKGKLQDLERLARLNECSLEELEPALRDGILFLTDGTYRFLHDRVQQAACALASEEKQQRVHLQIARLLTDPEWAVDDHVFDSLSHYQAAQKLLRDPEERLRVARLCLVGAQKAIASAANKTALEYSSFGVELLPDTPWISERDLTLALLLARAECAWRCGQPDVAEQEFGELLKHSELTDLERVRIHRLLIEVNTTQGKMQEAMLQCQRGLTVLGIDFPLNSNGEDVRNIYAVFRQSLGDRPIEALRDLPPIQDPREKAALDTMAAALPVSIYVSLNVATWLYCRMVILSIRHGSCDATASAYAYFAMILGSSFGQYEEAWRLGKVAYDLAQEGAYTWKARIFVIFGNVVNFWMKPLSSNIPYVRAALPAAREVGDFLGACYSCNHLISTLLAVGEPLSKVYIEVEKAQQLVRTGNFQPILDIITSQQLLILALQGRHPKEGVEDFDENVFEARVMTSQMAMKTFWHLTRKLQAAWMLGRQEDALAYGEAARPLRWASPCHVEEAEHHFYHALTLATACTDRADPRWDSWFQELLEYCDIFQRWSANCPENFGHKAQLLQAEVHRVKGEELAAMRCYEEAIRQARAQRFIQVEGISLELAARYYDKAGFQAFADQYSCEAKRCYQEWEASAKVQELERRFPQLKVDKAQQDQAPGPIDIDTISLLRATQSISSVIVPTELSTTLMRLLVEASGAERGFLILCRQGELVVEAEAQTLEDGLSVQTLNPIPAREFLQLPRAILNFVQRSQEKVVIADARQTHAFSYDESLRSHQPRSILCLPIVRNRSFVGLIYLENNLMVGAFTADKLTALEILASQAAISIENAHLYAELRSEEEKLRATLSSMVDGLLVTDAQGQISLINEAALRIIGLKDAHTALLEDRGALTASLNMKDATGKRVPLEELPLSQALRGATLYNEEYSICELTSGHNIFLRISSAPLRNPQDVIQGAVVVIRDVTELKELDQLKDEFLRAMAHELKTPLLVVHGYFEMFKLLKKKGAPDTALDDCMRRIDNGFQKLKSLVNTLVDVAVFQLRKLKLQLDNVDLHALGRERIAALASSAPNHQLSYVQVTDVPIMVRGDRVRLSQVLTIILQNAIKYSPQGGIIVLEIHEEKDKVLVRVQDQGIGIPLERQERLFQRFYRAHAETEHDYGGMGVGLFLALEIVQAHQGHIWFESQPGQGSTFFFSLPKAQRPGIE